MRFIIYPAKHIIFFLLTIFSLLFISKAVVAQEEDLGKTDRIWKVSIEGNERFEDLVIKRYIASEQPSVWKKLTFWGRSGYQLSETEVRKDVIRIERFYQRRGFNDVEVSYRIETKRKEWKKHIIFLVTENLPIRINNVDIELSASKADSAFIAENGNYSTALRRSPYRTGRIYEPIEETEVIARAEQALRRLGYPYPNTQIEARTDTISKKTDLVISTQAGPRATFDSIFVEGESTLSEELIIRESGLKKGNYYSEADMRNAQREVFKHHLFRLALVSIPNQPQDTSINVLLRVKELPLRSLQLKLGAGDFDRVIEDDGRITGTNFIRLFRGQATWVYRNVRGKGEQFSTSAKYSFYDRKLSAEYLFPYVYNTKSSININPFYQFRDERSYEILTAGIVNTFGYEYSRNLTGTFSYEYAINDESNVRSSNEQFNVEQILPDSLLSYNISSFAVNLYYTKNLRRGRRGIIIQPFLEFSGLFGESTFSFNKATLDVRKYSEINRNLVMATRLRGGAIYTVGQDSLPSDIKYYVGGTNSVRGWSTQFLGPKRIVESIETEEVDGMEVSDTTLIYVPDGGRTLFNFNVEFRQKLDGLVKGFGLAAFLDGGQVWRELNEVNLKNVQFGIGGGIRYESPIGPIRVDVGYKINPNSGDLKRFPNGVDQGGRFARWDIHFTIGQAF